MSSSDPIIDRRATFYMLLLALQFGIQPILTRRFTPDDINKSTVVLVQEIVKFWMAFAMLYLSGSVKSAFKAWNIETWISVAGIPAGLYAVQNLAALTAYQHLDGLTFNVLNQTKTLSAALCCYLVMGRKQSYTQVVALFCLLLAALIMEGILPLDMSLLHDNSTFSLSNLDSQRWTYGVAPILLASFISGLAGALSQKNLQDAGGGRNPYLFSMELCAASMVMFTIKLMFSKDLATLGGFWRAWTPSTMIPILSNATGGIIVGLVTKYAGSVRKGFALIFGILLSGLAQAMFQPDQTIKKEHVFGGVIAAFSLYLHATNPPRTLSPTTTSKKEQ